MIRYVPISSEPVALTLTRALWNLQIPAGNIGSRDTSRMWLVQEMKDGTHWLVADTEATVKIHLEAELGEIAGVLQPWILHGLIPADTNDLLTATIEAHRGQSLRIWDMFPDLFKGASRTAEQMQSSNLFKIP